jgi:signal transduction histidine kinase
MFRTLRIRLLVSFIAVSLGGIIFVSLAIHFGLQDSFRHYLDLKRQDQVKQVVRLLETEYTQRGEITGGNVVMLLHQQAMAENLFYQVYDHNNRLLVDSTDLIGMLDMMGHMMPGGGMMGSPSELREPQVFSQSYPLMAQSERIGELKVFYFEGYVATDFQFLGQINKYILGAALTIIVIAVLVSLLFSKRLTMGLNQLRDAARELKRHNLEVRIPVNPQQTEEMQELAVAFNDLAESLGHQEKLRKHFTGDLAHELRTPLATLRSQLEAFRDGVWQPTPQRLEQSHGELMRLVRLIDDLEKLLAAENPQIQLKKVPLEAGALLRSLGEHFMPAFREKGVELEVESPVENRWFTADRDRFMQIMTNLINNALKYTSVGGQVTLSAAGFKEKKAGEMVLFQIEDTGQGISEEDLPHIFERFYRGDKSRDRKTGGVGIGLSIVNALVQAHQGRIGIDSQPGQGTRVTVYLPAKG